MCERKLNWMMNYESQEFLTYVKQGTRNNTYMGNNVIQKTIQINFLDKVSKNEPTVVH